MMAKGFTILIMTTICVGYTKGQCNITGLFSYDHYDDISVRWDRCDQTHVEYLVEYQLISACGTWDPSGAPPFDLKTSNWFRDNYFLAFKIEHGIHANSTYQFTVKSREWQADNYVYGSSQSVNYTTGTDIYLQMSSFGYSSTFIAQWSTYPIQCVSYGSTEYEYHFVHNGAYIAQYRVTNNTKIIMDLECEARYHFRVTYITDSGTGPDSWGSISKDLYDPPMPVVRLSGSSDTSLLFTWNSYLPCNIRNEIKAWYEFELKEYNDHGSIVRSGSTTDTFASFSDLNLNRQYRMEVRVKIKSSATGSVRYSSAGVVYVYTVVSTPTLEADNKGNHISSIAGGIIAGVGIGLIFMICICSYL